MGFHAAWSKTFSLKTSAGVFQPKHLRGVALRRAQITSRCLCEIVEGSISRGNHLRARRFVFSTVPFCHGALGSQNQVCVPTSACRCGQSMNSEPAASASRGLAPLTAHPVHLAQNRLFAPASSCVTIQMGKLICRCPESSTFASLYFGPRASSVGAIS